MTVPFVRFVGRQPILDASRQLFGYELLFRSGTENSFSGDPRMATRQMIDNVLVLGLDTLAPGGKAFINCTYEALVEGLVTSLPSPTTVLEVLESVVVDDAVVAACEELKAKGFEIALDDYEPGSSTDRLLHLADYIKLDLRALSTERLRGVKDGLAGHKAKLLAEKVETEEEFRHALSCGFRYFQGYFFCRPIISEHRAVPQNQLIYLQLIKAVSREHYDVREIERLVLADASLCFRVLRMVNSASMPVRSYITSIRQALLMLGTLELRKLVTLASAASLGSSLKVIPELMLRAFHHARFCELLAARSGQSGSEQYLIGLLSHFDAILQVPMAQIVSLVSLSKQANAALCGMEGEAGLPLRMLKHYETRDWSSCAAICRTLKISEPELEAVYVTSLRWATAGINQAGL